MISKKNIALTALALLASVSTASAQTLLLSDNFDDGILTGWTRGGLGQIEEINHQFRRLGQLRSRADQQPNGYPHRRYPFNTHFRPAS